MTGLPDTPNFETSDNLTALPALSRFALYRPFTVPPVSSGTSVFAVRTQALVTAGVTIQSGDKLLLVAPGGGTNPYRQDAVVDKVETRLEFTEITIKGSWVGSAAASVMRIASAAVSGTSGITLRQRKRRSAVTERRRKRS